MVLFDICTIILWFYLFSNYVWNHLFKIFICLFLYIGIKLGIVHEKLLEITSIHPKSKQYFETICHYCSKYKTKIDNHKTIQRLINTLMHYIMITFNFILKYIELFMDLIERQFKKNEKISNVFNAIEIKINENKNNVTRFKKMFGQIDIKKMYTTLKQIVEMQKQMQQMQQMQQICKTEREEEYESDSESDSDDIFEYDSNSQNLDEKSEIQVLDNVNSSKLETIDEKSEIQILDNVNSPKLENIDENLMANLFGLMPSNPSKLKNVDNNLMTNLFKSMPPELLQQSIKEAQNIDMSKIDMNRMMSDMNQMMKQVGSLQTPQNIMKRSNKRVNKKRK